MVRIPLVAGPAGARRPIGAPAGRDIGFDSHDRDHSAGLGLAQELDRPEHVAMVGQRNRRHPQRLDPLDQVRDLARPVQQAVMAVAMKMHEGLC